LSEISLKKFKITRYSFIFEDHLTQIFRSQTGHLFRACLDFGFRAEKQHFFDYMRHENRSLALAK